MRFILRRLFLWSWVLTLPLALAGGYLAFRTIDRFYTYQIRYNPKPIVMSLGRTLRYEKDQLLQLARVKTSPESLFQKTNLGRVNLFVPAANLAQLESHMPQSGFEYVRGAILIDGVLKKAKVKYRGDYVYHWGWDKKSIRVKTGKGALLDGLRAFNLQAPKTWSQLNNYFSFELAKTLGLLVPRTDMVRLYLNGKDRGIHLFVEQLSETTLRNANLMPGDIYRGEMIAKDKFSSLGKTMWLFDSVSLWDKVSINNHYGPESSAPLKALLDLIKSGEHEQSQTLLSELMDMEAWGRFSVFETLASTKHYSKSHNWRIYFDPWRGKLVPVVWDPVGWLWDPPELILNVVRSRLHQLLFQNGDFLRARNAALASFFSSGKDTHFLDSVSDTIEMMTAEIKTDAFLRPGNAAIVTKAMYKLEKKIRKTFSTTQKKWAGNHNPGTRFSYGDTQLDLSVGGNRSIQAIRLNFDRELKPTASSTISYELLGKRNTINLTGSTKLDAHSMTLKASLLPDLIIDPPISSAPQHVKAKPGYYQINFNGLDPNTKLTGLDVDYGQGWVPAQPVDSITPTAFSQLYAPVAVNTIPEPIIWSGEVTIEGHQILDQPLIIEPGTTINLAPKATVVLKHHLTAIGTREAPIRFISATTDQDPWGAIVLSGRGADGSTLSHCEMSDGSGLKGDLFEYSAMLSIHDVKNVVISDCHFKNNHTVDDMVHTVYADIRFERVRFENALSDALDLDISTASISDSYFEHSGNDAVDLMTTAALITGSVFKNNGDKGISVGENSQLYAVNNQLTGNSIGVESKDRSTAILLNQTFTDNKIALHAYKKNWRYGEGGTIFLAKSVVSGEGVSATAKKRSAIQIFDSYLEVPAKGKRVDTIAVNDDHSRSALHNELLPDLDLVDSRLMDQLENIPADLLEHITPDRRGSAIDG